MRRFSPILQCPSALLKREYRKAETRRKCTPFINSSQRSCLFNRGRAVGVDREYGHDAGTQRAHGRQRQRALRGPPQPRRLETRLLNTIATPGILRVPSGTRRKRRRKRHWGYGFEPWPCTSGSPHRTPPGADAIARVSTARWPRRARRDWRRGHDNDVL